MRKGMAQGLARPVYSDRNPVTKMIAYGAGGIAPHTLTVRATYTCPAGKKTFIEALYAMITRDGAAGTPAQQNARIQFSPIFGGGGDVLWARNFAGNTIGVQDRDARTSFGLMVPGDILTLNTQDASITGTGDYELAAKFVEFDI